MKQKNHDYSTITFMWIKHEHPTYDTCCFSRICVSLDIQIEGKMGVTVKRIVKKKDLDRSRLGASHTLGSISNLIFSTWDKGKERGEGREGKKGMKERRATNTCKCNSH